MSSPTSGNVQRISYPTLEQYVSLTPRKVTPIYASYCSLAVSLLDIHVGPPTLDNDPVNTSSLRFEILESGTGHGSLTMHLARAIAAANPAPPALPPSKPERQTTMTDSSEATSPNSTSNEGSFDYAEWQRHRRAVVHSVEITSAHSQHAAKLIRSFRQGMYWPHIDFHIDSVSSWVDGEVSKRQESQQPTEFLDIVVLDMPSAHTHIAKATSALKNGGQLMVFMPQITQICDCVKEIESHRLPLVMQTVVELGEGLSNGRTWDVRMVQRRKSKKVDTPGGAAGTTIPTSPTAANEVEVSEAGTAGEVEGTTTTEEAGSPVGRDGLVKKGVPEGAPEVEGKDEFEEEAEEAAIKDAMICRPKVGKLTSGGGFIGSWRKESPLLVSSSLTSSSSPASSSMSSSPHSSPNLNGVVARLSKQKRKRGSSWN